MASENPYAGGLAYIREHGWHQGGMFSFKGTAFKDAPGCIIGACFAVNDVERAEWREGLKRTIVSLGYKLSNTLLDSSAVIQWNDDPARTQEDVELVLKHAAYDWDIEHA